MEPVCADWRQRLLEIVADSSDEFLEKYLENGLLGIEDIKTGLRIATIEGKVVPVLCGSAFKNIGVQILLDAIIDFLPSPKDMPPIIGRSDSHVECREASDDAPFSALVFKISTDPFVGTLCYIRVYSGVLRTGQVVFNSAKGKRERIGRLIQMHANVRMDIDEVRAGDISAVAGLKHASTGDTLCDESYIIALERMDFPEPVISVSLEPRSKSDEEKLKIALERLTQEDPTFRVDKSADSGQIVISGMGELHIEILVDRMKREFGVAVTLGSPRVEYKESINTATEQVAAYDRQLGDKNHYGQVKIRINPEQRGFGFIFRNELNEADFPDDFVRAVEKGVVEQLRSGVLGGYPTTDLSVSLIDAIQRDGESTEIAFEVAGAMAIETR